MKARCIAILSAALLVGAAAAQDAPATEAKSYLLRYALAKGQTSRVVIAQKQESDVDAGGQKMKSAAESKVTMKWEVTGVEDGKAAVRGEVERIQLEADSSMMGGISYDSDDEDAEAPPMMASVEDVVGMVVTYKMDGRGVVSDVRTNRDVGQGVVDMSAMLTQMTVVFPEEPVVVGGKWTQETAFGMQMVSAEGTAKYELLGVEGKSARVRVVMDLETEPSEDAPAPFDLEIKEAAGEITVNFAQPITSAGTMATKMHAEMAGQMEMDLTMTQNITPAPEKKPDSEGGDGQKNDGQKSDGGK